MFQYVLDENQPFWALIMSKIKILKEVMFIN